MATASEAGPGPTAAAWAAVPGPDDDVIQKGIDELKRKLNTSCHDWFSASFAASKGKPSRLATMGKRAAWSRGPMELTKILLQILQDTEGALFALEDSRCIAADLILSCLHDLAMANKKASALTDLHPSFITALQTCAIITAASYDSLYGPRPADTVMRATRRHFKAPATDNPDNLEPARAPAAKRNLDQRTSSDKKTRKSTTPPPPTQPRDAVMRRPHRAFNSREAVPAPASLFRSDPAKRQRSRTPSVDGGPKRGRARPADK